MAKFNKRRFPTNPKDYQMYEEVGEGVNSSVYKALCIPLNEIVAIKVLDLENCDNDLDGIRCEVRTMTLTIHPNLLHAYCSFTSDCYIWVVMPYMAAGSCFHIMKYAYPAGFQKLIVATILREVLKSLVYLHGNGLTHRKIKAGNILLDANGAIKLADFGSSACIFDTGNKKQPHNTSVETPYWIAPEVVQQLHEYDYKADIWSFGMTALELAHGHDLFSKYPPMKVVLMTLQNASPGLCHKKNERFSKSFKKLVSACLAMDPKKRPTSEKLLKHSFFRHSRSNDYLVQTILNGLAPLDERFRILKGKDADVLKQNKVVFPDKEQLSQQDYIHGISAWNFNLEDLKARAALIDVDNNHKLTESSDEVDSSIQNVPPQNNNQSNASNSSEDGPQVLLKYEVPSASIMPPVHSLGAYRNRSDYEDDGSNTYRKEIDSGSLVLTQEPLQTDDLDGESIERSSSVPKNIYALARHRYSSGQLYEQTAEDDRGDLHKRHLHQHKRNPSGPLLPSQPEVRMSVSGSTREELSAGRVIQHKGRFKITSEEDNEVAPSENSTPKPVIGTSSNFSKDAIIALPMLQLLMQQSNMQKETLANLIMLLEQGYDNQAEHFGVGSTEVSQTSAVLSMEKELQRQVILLEQCVKSAEIEVQKLKLKNTKARILLRSLAHSDFIMCFISVLFPQMEYQINGKSFKLGKIAEEDDGSQINKEEVGKL